VLHVTYAYSAYLTAVNRILRNISQCYFIFYFRCVRWNSIL